MSVWHWVDIPRVRTIQLPSNKTTSEIRDIEWMGIRKGGERWHNLGRDDSGLWAIEECRPTHTSNPIVRHVLEIPSAPGNWNPLGITNDKKSVIISSRDSTGATADRLCWYDIEGNLLRDLVVSDASDRDNSRLTYLEHDLYVLAQEGGDAPWRIKVYDQRAELIRKIVLTSLSTLDSCRGITTDGKYLYVLVIRPSNHAFDKIVKVDVRGTVVRSSWSPGDNQEYLNGITFNGHYLLARIDESPPGDPI